MSTYESTITVMKDMTEADLLIVSEFVNRLARKDQVRAEMYNPYRPLTREEIVEQLSLAKKHSDEGKVLDAYQASENIREKYGL